MDNLEDDVADSSASVHDDDGDDFFDECYDVVDYANDLGDGECDDANDSNQGTDDNHDAVVNDDCTDDSGECDIDDYNSGKCERLTDDKVDDGAHGFDSRIIITWFIVGYSINLRFLKRRQMQF